MTTQIMRKLQYALKQEGYLVCIPTTQFFNPKSERFVKVFHIKHYKKELYSTASLIKAVMYLVELLKVIQQAKQVRNKDKYINEHIKELEDIINERTTQSQT